MRNLYRVDADKVLHTEWGLRELAYQFGIAGQTSPRCVELPIRKVVEGLQSVGFVIDVAGVADYA